MAFSSSIVFFSALVAVGAQQIGTLTPEVHPAITSQKCTASGCTTVDTSIVIDANWRWTHAVGDSTNCYTGNTWDATLCPDPLTCAENCALEGADYESTYGITTSGDSVTLGFVTGSNVGSRVYLAASDTEYQIFQLNNREFTFDVDVSKLPCGINGALYFSEMSADGGTSQYPTNKAGAQYGTGYCDAQCPQDLKYINGLANVQDWTGSSNDANSGTGMYGSCCNEMDIWEANSMATALTAHPCSVQGQTECNGTACGGSSGSENRYNGNCDADGCDFNPWRMGNTSFFGQSLIVDTTKPFTVVTQFITEDGTDTGALSKINRFYVQDGVTIPNSESNIVGVDATNSISDDFCSQQKTAFNDTNEFATKGGLATMQKAFAQGMVLVLSIWDDYAADCLWLDSTYPTDAAAGTPGASRGPCSTNSGVPAQVESQYPGASVTFSNIKVGTIGSTVKGGPSGGGGGSTTSISSPQSSSPPPPPSSSAPASPPPSSVSSAPPSPSATSVSSAPPTSSSTCSGGGTASQWGQCGGENWTGPTTCASPYTCQYQNPWYSQCL